jgi:hypothetical protein
MKSGDSEDMMKDVPIARLGTAEEIAYASPVALPPRFDVRH